MGPTTVPGSTRTISRVLMDRVALRIRPEMKDSERKAKHAHRVTVHVVPNPPLTPKQSCVSVHGPHTKYMMSTEWSPCTVARWVSTCRLRPCSRPRMGSSSLRQGCGAVGSAPLRSSRLPGSADTAIRNPAPGTRSTISPASAPGSSWRPRVQTAATWPTAIRLFLVSQNMIFGMNGNVSILWFEKII